MEKSEWMTEIRIDNMVFAPGTEFSLTIRYLFRYSKSSHTFLSNKSLRCEADGFNITVSGQEFYTFTHRGAPDAINGLYVSGRVKLFKIIYKTPQVIVPLRDIFWRQMGGHLRRVETCKSGVTWGIGYDNTAWVYTGGWGGVFMKGLEQSSTGINNMTDTHNYYIYENQRWNPLSGYTAHGLPTDRHSWSDITGRHKRSKEHTKLLSIHWQWVRDNTFPF